MTIPSDVQKAVTELSAFLGRIKTSTQASKKSAQKAKDNLEKIKTQLETGSSSESAELSSEESQATSIEGFFLKLSRPCFLVACLYSKLT